MKTYDDKNNLNIGFFTFCFISQKMNYAKNNGKKKQSIDNAKKLFFALI